MEWIYFFLSLVASFIFSLGGVGGAIVLIPSLVWLGIPLGTARPVGLFYNVVSMSSASVDNIREKRLDVGMGIALIVSSFLMAMVGASLSSYLPKRIILLLFVGFLLFSSGMLFFYKRGKLEDYRQDIPHLKLALIGGGAGILSGILGIGGGAIIMPSMVLLGFNPKKVTALTAFVVPFSSLSGFWVYWAKGSVDWRLTLIVSVGGMIGAALGTRLSHKKLEPQKVKKILAIILLIMAAKMSFKLFF